MEPPFLPVQISGDPHLTLELLSGALSMRPHLPAALLGVLVVSVTSLTLGPECTHPPQRLTLI